MQIDAFNDPPSNQVSTRWRLRREIPPGPDPWRHIQEQFDLSREAARLAWLRGEDSPESLVWRLDPAWKRAYDPFLLEGLGLALGRIKAALAAQERIVIYGDYDVDGVTATALMVRVLERLGGRVEFFIPNRFNDGYGLHWECIQELCDRGGPGLFISVDCGIRSVEEVESSSALGIEWIITDHHALGAVLPPAVACLHPQLGGHPNHHLAGVGVAFKLAQALLDAYPTPSSAEVPFLDGLLKLVALGSIADMVPLKGENALLVKRGLMALAGANGPGIQELLRLARIEGIPRAQDIAFGVSPRLNAVGRMGGAEEAVHLLLTRNFSEAKRLAEKVEAMNSARKETQEWLSNSLPQPLDSAAFDLAVLEGAHKGVLGIVAAKRMRLTGKPTGVGAIQDGMVHCSLRAPEGFDLTELIEMARPFLSRGGGHRAAAGISFAVSRLPFVRSTLNKGATLQAQNVESLPLALDGAADGELPSPRELMALEPFGQGFPEPLYYLEAELEAVQSFGNGHSKLRLVGIPHTCTWFFSSAETTGICQGERVGIAASIQDQVRWGRSWKLDTLLYRKGYLQSDGGTGATGAGNGESNQQGRCV